MRCFFAIFAAAAAYGCYAHCLRHRCLIEPPCYERHGIGGDNVIAACPPPSLPARHLPTPTPALSSSPSLSSALFAADCHAPAAAIAIFTLRLSLLIIDAIRRRYAAAELLLIFRVICYADASAMRYCWHTPCLIFFRHAAAATAPPCWLRAMPFRYAIAAAAAAIATPPLSLDAICRMLRWR